MAVTNRIDTQEWGNAYRQILTVDNPTGLAASTLYRVFSGTGGSEVESALSLSGSAVRVEGTDKLQFNNDAVFIRAGGATSLEIDGDDNLNLVADTEIDLTASDIDINGDVDISGQLDVGSKLVIATNNELLLRDSGSTVSSSVSNQLDLDATNVIELTAPTVRVVASTLFDVNGDTDLNGDITMSGSSKSFYLNANTLVIDADGDTSIEADGDDDIEYTIAGAVKYHMVATAFHPETDNNVDLGTSGLKWKDLYIDGVAYFDKADFNGAAAAIVIDEGGNTYIQATTNNLLEIWVGGEGMMFLDYSLAAIYPRDDNTYSLGKTGNEWKDLYIDGTAHLDNVEIGGGSIEATTIGESDPSSGVFTTLEVSGTQTLDGDTNCSGNVTMSKLVSYDGTPQSLTAPAATTINATTYRTRITATATASLTISNGSQDGQTKVIECISIGAGDTATLTTGIEGTSLVFDSRGESAHLQWNSTSSSWYVIGTTATYTP